MEGVQNRMLVSTHPVLNGLLPQCKIAHDVCPADVKRSWGKTREGVVVPAVIKLAGIYLAGRLFIEEQVITSDAAHDVRPANMDVKKDYFCSLWMSETC